ncbi:S-layer homology domain-containing protein, partial [Bifidobacterium pseudolongum subsp. globosum]
GKSATVKVTVASDYVAVSSVAISGTGVSGGKATINVGAGLNLTATVSPSNASDKTVKWTTSNATVATVDANGAVRAVKAGNAAITATAGDKFASILVTVKENGVAVRSVSIVGEGVENNRLTIASNVRRQLSAQLTPANATVGAIYWSSSDTTVATVSGSGYIVPKAPGVAAITVTAGDTHASIVLTVTKAASRFPDVPKSHHFYGDIEWLAEKGITTGNADGTFTPQEDTTRAQTVVFLYRLAVSRGDASAANFKPTEADYKRFPDVKQGTFGAKEILWAANIGLTTGRPDGTFGGDVAVTRDQMVMFLNRFAMMEGDEVARSYRPKDTEYAKFSDVKQGTFAAREILWAVSVGIVNGGTGKFNCSDSTAREQMAAFLHRLDTHLNK